MGIINHDHWSDIDVVKQLQGNKVVAQDAVWMVQLRVQLQAAQQWGQYGLQTYSPTLLTTTADGQERGENTWSTGTVQTRRNGSVDWCTKEQLEQL